MRWYFEYYWSKYNIFNFVLKKTVVKIYPPIAKVIVLDGPFDKIFIYLSPSMISRTCGKWNRINSRTYVYVGSPHVGHVNVGFFRGHVLSASRLLTIYHLGNTRRINISCFLGFLSVHLSLFIYVTLYVFLSHFLS